MYVYMYVCVCGSKDLHLTLSNQNIYVDDHMH